MSKAEGALKLTGSATETTISVFQGLLGGDYKTVRQFDGVRVDPPKSPSPDRWLGIARCVVGPKNGRADSQEVWAVGLIEYRRDKSDRAETLRLKGAMAALGIDLEEVLNEGTRYASLRSRVIKEILGQDFDPKDPHAKEVDRVGVISRKGLDWMYEHTEFGLLSRDDQLFVIDWQTRAEAFNGNDLPDAVDPVRRDRQTAELQRIIVPLREAVEHHGRTQRPWDDQRRLSQAVLARAAAYEEQSLPLAQLAVEIDPTNVAAQRMLASRLIGKGEHQKAKAHLALAVTHEQDPRGFSKTVAVAQNLKDPEVGNGWDFVIRRLEKENRTVEAADVSRLGYGNPHYFPLTRSPSGRIHQALLKAGIRPSEIGHGSGPATVRDLWSFVGRNFKDSKVLGALKAADVPLPWLDRGGVLKPEYADVDRINFGKLLGTHYSDKAGVAKDARAKERALLLAIHYQPTNSERYVALGDLYFSHQHYQRALDAYRGATKIGFSEAGSLGVGRSFLMMGDLAGAHDAYGDYLNLDSRNAEVRTARLEVNLMRLTGGQATIEEVGAEILRDQSMLRFLNPATDREAIKTLSTDLDPGKAGELEQKAREFLLLSGVEHARSKDTEELAQHYSSLAAKAYRTLEAWASGSSDSATREMSSIYRANAYAAEGNLDEAEKTYRALIDQVAPRFVFGSQYVGKTEAEKGKNALTRILWKKQGEKMVVEGKRLIDEGTKTGDQGKIARGRKLAEDGEYKIKICHPYTEEPSPAVLEALGKLDAIAKNRTRGFHLAAVDFWEGIVAEQEKVKGKDSFRGDTIGGEKGDFRFDADLERKLIASVREILISDQTGMSLDDAIRQAATIGSDPDLSAYARQYTITWDSLDTRPANVIGYLLDYADDGFPPRKESAERLLAKSYQVEKGGYGSVAVGGYQFVTMFSSEKEIRDQAEKRIRLATGNGGFWETVEEIGNRTFGGDTPDEMAQNLMVNFVALGAVGKVGTIARLATAERLSKSGAAAWKVWAYSRGVGAAAGGTAFFLYGTHQELQHGNPDDVLSMKHLARRWGASVVLMGFAEFGGGASSFVGKSDVAQWVVGHAGGFTGMVAGGYANRLFHLEDGSLADWAPLAGAIALYPAYAAGGALTETPAGARNAVSLRGVNEARLFFGLEGEITPEKVNTAYRRFKLRHHSDRIGGEKADHGLLTRADALRAYLLREVCGGTLSNAQNKMADDYIASLSIARPAQPDEAQVPPKGDPKAAPAGIKTARPSRGHWRFQAGAIRISRGGGSTPHGDGGPRPIRTIEYRPPETEDGTPGLVVDGQGAVLLGSGANGDVFIHPKDSNYAIKYFRLNEENHIEREFENLKRLKGISPRPVAWSPVGGEGQGYLTMERVRGWTVEELITARDNGRLTADQEAALRAAPEAINRLIEKLVEGRIDSWDVNDRNVMIGRVGGDSTVRAYFVDAGMIRDWAGPPEELREDYWRSFPEFVAEGRGHGESDSGKPSRDDRGGTHVEGVAGSAMKKRRAGMGPERRKALEKELEEIAARQALADPIELEIMRSEAPSQRPKTAERITHEAAIQRFERAYEEELKSNPRLTGRSNILSRSDGVEIDAKDTASAGIALVRSMRLLKAGGYGVEPSPADETGDTVLMATDPVKRIAFGVRIRVVPEMFAKNAAPLTKQVLDPVSEIGFLREGDVVDISWKDGTVVVKDEAVRDAIVPVIEESARNLGLKGRTTAEGGDIVFHLNGKARLGSGLEAPSGDFTIRIEIVSNQEPAGIR